MKYALLLLLLVTFTADACPKPRSSKAKTQFAHRHPCPATGIASPHRCPGYVLDHRIGMCVGGHDVPGNLRWMTVEAAKAKDKWECKPGWQEKLAACEAAGCFVEWKP